MAILFGRTKRLGQIGRGPDYEGPIMRNISLKIFEFGQVVQYMWFKILSRALDAIFIGGAEPFKQFWQRPL